MASRGIGKSVHSPGQKAFCELMVKARRAAGLTQQDVAKRLRKPQSFVAKYEGGERRIDVVEFLAITRAIGADHPAGAAEEAALIHLHPPIRR